MQKVIFLFIILPVLCNSQSDSTGGTYQPYGVFSFSNDFNPAHWAISGHLFSFAGNKIIASGGDGQLQNYIWYKREQTSLENWQLVMTYNIGIVNSTSFGIGIGIQSFALNDSISHFSAHEQWEESGRNFLDIYLGNDYQCVNGRTTLNVTPVAGDLMCVTLTRFYNTYIATVHDITQHSDKVTEKYMVTNIFNYNAKGGEAQSILNKCGFPCIWEHGGSDTIKSWTFSSLDTVEADLWIVGDSKAEGYYASSINNRWANQLKIPHKRITAVAASAGETTTDIVNELPELFRFCPREVIIDAGSNDIRFGVDDDTWQSNFLTIQQKLDSAKIPWWFLNQTPEGRLNLTSMNTWMNDSLKNIIDVWTTFDSSSGNGGHTPYMKYVLPDTIHYSPLGEDTIYAIINRKLNKIKN